MSYLIALLFYAALAALVVGLFRPGAVVRWTDDPTRGQVAVAYGGGAMLLLVVFALIEPPLESDRATRSSEPQLAISVDRCASSAGGYHWIEGTVANEGDVTVSFVRLRLTFADDRSDVVDTGSTYAVGSEFLRPGESSTFRGSTQHGSAVQCNAELLDYRRVR